MATQQDALDAPDQQIDVTAAEWLMIIVTGFTGVFAGPFAIIPGIVLIGMFTYRVNLELMRNTAAGKWVQGLLPARPTSDEQDAPSSAPPVPPSSPAAAAVGAGAIVAAQSATRTLAMIDVATLARCSTILLVGSRGSGKSTLLRALLEAKKAHSLVAVYDPHAAPNDWPMAQVIHNSEDAISKGMASAYKRLQSRKDERRKGIRTSGWPKITLAADEWGNIVANVKMPKEIEKTPSEVSTELMKEGRKFEIEFVAGAHGLTNKSLGCVGDQEVFLQSFDWIIHMGGFTRKLLQKEYADLLDQIPMGQNEQGGTFPLIVACESPTTGEIRLLDMRGLDMIVYTSAAKPTPVTPWQQTQPSADNTLLTGMLSGYQSDNELSSGDNKSQPSLSMFQASQREVVSLLSVAETAVSLQEIARITVQLQQGKTPAAIAKILPGYNSRNYQEYKRKVDYVKTLTDIEIVNNDASGDDNTNSDE